ncbi:hypothetical protein BIFANG_03345 [Bifidobacterium angulatum DSM 20098 = JCM 7096]|nr:hypothetical protein BIFANG_03345 [Bifidobacterium angulatum DSM 20098 = JCM 7096]
MCGEHAERVILELTKRGSSPRVRGTRYGRDLVSAPPGIIPACAGNTYIVSLATRLRRDHPRVCGEHQVRDTLYGTTQGSSPRVRGTRDGGRHDGARPGIIPACAGNTWQGYAIRPICRDHPRVCGEHVCVDGAEACALGSSPRVRGTLTVSITHGGFSGIIPACAGNTLRWSVLGLMHWDHPRVCGEHKHQRCHANRYRGSSPRVRGTHLATTTHVLRIGIIPACAGNTTWRVRWSISARDHPRVCGEHNMSFDKKRYRKGSSPRVRGTRVFPRPERAWRGIIPACAGNTLGVSYQVTAIGDHPRVCGEHRNSGNFSRVSLWIIPACAGNTNGRKPSNDRNRDHPRVCGEHVRGRDMSAPMWWIIPACAGNTGCRRSCVGQAEDHPRVCGEHSARLSPSSSV